MVKWKIKKVEKEQNAQETWRGLEKEYSKIFDNFKYMNFDNKKMFLNLIIAESIKYSTIDPISCNGLLFQISSDISNFVRLNMSKQIGNKEHNYIG